MQASNSHYKTVVTRENLIASEEQGEGVRCSGVKSNGTRLDQLQALVRSFFAQPLGVKDLERARDAFVGLLREVLPIDQVALCLMSDKDELALTAICEQAIFDIGSYEFRQRLDECHEYLEYERVICNTNETQLAALASHGELIFPETQIGIVSMPLYDNSAPVAALGLEQRNKGYFDLETIKLLGLLSSLASPCQGLRMTGERRLWARAKTQLV